MVWYGVVWYGMVWYGMVWYGMVWYGVVWFGMTPRNSRTAARRHQPIEVTTPSHHHTSYTFDRNTVVK